MPRPEVRVQVQVKPTLTVRRPPRQLIDLLDKPEDEFRDYVRAVEDSVVFQSLVESGAIRRVKTRGRVPREKYEEYMDVQLMQFLRQYRITAHEHWERDFLDREALVRLPELAERYNAPAARLKKIVEYYQRVTSDNYGMDGSSHAGDFESDEPDYLELIPSRADVDMTDSIVLMREFVESYGLEQAQFVVDFMQGQEDAVTLAERYGAPLAEVEEILDALGRLHIVETFVAGGGPPEALGRPSPQASAEDLRPVAKVMLTDHGRCVAIAFTDDSVYAQRYRTSPDALSRATDLSDAAAAEALLLELQWINQRKTLLCRLVMAVCQFQYRFFLTRDVYALKPLSQADIARELGEDEATICRLLRDKIIESPDGLMELRFLFQRKTDVVRRIVERNPHLTDSEIRDVLARDYGAAISRRTVAYHRLKFQRDGRGGEEA
jgi:transcriptional regulator with XRE-family HTH domain